MARDLDALASALHAEEEQAAEYNDMPEGSGVANGPSWFPDLNPTQTLIFNDASPIIVAVGEKGTGKSIGCLHKVVRHAYENFNALILVIAPTQSTGFQGAGVDLETFILPMWEKGFGLKFTKWKLDPVTKDRHLWIGNRYGGYSMVLLKSIPFGSQVEARVKGPAPSMVYVDELTNCDSRNYFTFPRGQLGRRRGISGPQQYVASCNPEGTTHWVYKLLYEESDGFVYKTMREGAKAYPHDREKPGIIRDSSLSVYYVPFAENKHRLDPQYLIELEKTLRADPILRARLIDGRWIDRPSGEALFRLYFSEPKHVVGDEKKKKGILPVKGYPIVLGYDLGKVNSSIIFQQCIETKFGPFWLVFDELCYTDEKIGYKRLTRLLLNKMAYWNRRMSYTFTFKHVSDSSAFNQFHAGKGSTDVRDILQYSKEYLDEDAAKESDHLYPGIKPIKLRECPKPPDSVEDRVGLAIDLLTDKMIIVSATCKWVKNMFLHLQHEEGNTMEPKRGKYIHTFDAMSYPQYYRKYVAVTGFREEGNQKAVEVVSS